MSLFAKFACWAIGSLIGTKLKAVNLPFILFTVYLNSHISWFSCKSLTVFLAFSLFSQSYSAHAAYCHSKLAQVLFSSHLHQELQRGGFPLSSCAVDPGMVDTALYRHLWTPLCLVQRTIAHLLFRVKHCPDFHLLYSHIGQVWFVSSCKTAKQIWYKYWTTF